MCGIAGVLCSKPEDSLHNIIRDMTISLNHRGPDDQGIWVDNSRRVALGHARLSILDLSSAGNQPMMSSCERYIIVFNGEIYNHLELRAQLDSALEDVNTSLSNKIVTNRWRGHSDTEVLLTAFSTWGIDITLKKIKGMFAIALLDKQESRLHLIRDRFGEKPLYYGWINNSFCFGSELKAIKKYPGFNNDIDRNVLSLYFRYNYVPVPYSIYRNIYKLEPGSMLSVNLDSFEPDGNFTPAGSTHSSNISITKWYRINDVTLSSKNNLLSDEKLAINVLEEKLRNTISLQSIADVPVGAFLSGGIDSSLIVSLMQSQNNIPVKTFTIGSFDKSYDEALFASSIARYLGTDHTEIYVTDTQAREVIPYLPDLYDEPFADSSQIPTYLVSKIAKEKVTVSLSGDGGDELFGGYNRYLWSQRIWSKVSWMPFSVRSKLGSTLSLYSPQQWDSFYSTFNKYLGKNSDVVLFGDKVHKMADRLKYVSSLDDLYISLISQWKSPDELVIGGNENTVQTLISSRSQWPKLRDHNDLMMYLDMCTYLPDDILCKVDRAAMGVSLETRIPFLDHDIVEFAQRLPNNMKIRNRETKWILRQLLYKFVPREMIERPKQGFSIPLGEWLRGPLRDWAENLLNSNRVLSEGYLRPEIINVKWKEHIDGTRNWEYHLWSILMFQSWLDRMK